MANNLASIAFRTARHSLQNSIKIHGAQVSIRAASASNVHADYGKIKDKQDNFLTPDETPVFRKGGPFDSILYKFTMGLCATSLSLIAYNIITLAVKK